MDIRDSFYVRGHLSFCERIREGVVDKAPIRSAVPSGYRLVWNPRRQILEGPY